MLMPEASMHEDYASKACNTDIWRTRQAFAMRAVSDFELTQNRSDGQLWPCIALRNARHKGAAGAIHGRFRKASPVPMRLTLGRVCFALLGAFAF
jgi:hypothetical protein